MSDVWAEFERLLIRVLRRQWEDEARGALDDFVRRLVEDRERLDWLEGNAVALYRDDDLEVGRLWRIDTHRREAVAQGDEIRAVVDDARGSAA